MSEPKIPVATTLYSVANDRRFVHWLWEPHGDGPFPLLVLLHGVHDGDGSVWWQEGRAHETVAQLIADRTIPPMVVMMPSDTGAGSGSGYCDWVDGTTAAETYLIRELLPWANANLPVMGRPFVTGLSMGGYGAWMLALRNPGTFASATATSGFFSPRRLFDFVVDNRVRMWASDENEAAHDVTVLVQDLARRQGLRLAFDCGTDDALIDHNRGFRSKLTVAGIAHGWAEHPGGHDWSYWRDHLADHLRFHAGIEGPLDDCC